MSKVKYPCRNCVYRNACGDYSRTMPCDGRMNKREVQAMVKRAEEKYLKGEN